MTSDWVEKSFQLLEQGRNGSRLDRVKQLQLDAYDCFRRLGFPTTRNEDWKYTNVAPIAKAAFVPASGKSEVPAEAKLEELLHALPEAARMVFVDGAYRPELSHLEGVPTGFSIGSLASVLSAGKAGEPLFDAVERHLGKIAAYEEQPFTALNTALLNDGVVIHLAKGCVSELPVHLVFLSSGEEAEVSSHTRVLLVAESQSEATVMETYSALQDGKYLTTTVTEAYVSSDASITHYKLNLESEQAYHVGSIDVMQEGNSVFGTHSFSFGGLLVRNEVNPTLNGQGIHTTMNGLSVLAGIQHVDNHTVIDHAKPHCESNEWYKGIYADRSHGVFNGTIIVRQDAQKTNAIQSNQSLLLSPEAESDSKPQLKIWADDVRCTHGATIGQLDDDALFYLRSRGIDKTTARDLLVEAFAGDIIGQLEDASLKNYLTELLFAKLEATRAAAQ